MCSSKCLNIDYRRPRGLEFMINDYFKCIIFIPPYLPLLRYGSLIIYVYTWIYLIYYIMFTNLMSS